jgi:hypothetical protein
MNASDDKWLAGDASEAYMGRWSRPLARAFVEWLRPKPSAHWLEVGCGTGARTQTIMKGAKYCDFRYRMKSGQSSKPDSA